ncbi:hypothetical protein HOY82DRAFT_538798 [Tuber indicum]|nr:hypothetical protein HOY82DRAFT_538798 [Tuber indicum]
MELCKILVRITISSHQYFLFLWSNHLQQHRMMDPYDSSKDVSVWILEWGSDSMERGVGNKRMDHEDADNEREGGDVRDDTTVEHKWVHTEALNWSILAWNAMPLPPVPPFYPYCHTSPTHSRRVILPSEFSSRVPEFNPPERETNINTSIPFLGSFFKLFFMDDTFA